MVRDPLKRPLKKDRDPLKRPLKKDRNPFKKGFLISGIGSNYPKPIAGNHFRAIFQLKMTRFP